MSGDSPLPTRLSGEDLTFWWADSPMQPTTMAMLMLLDRIPDEQRLLRAFERAVAAVPRLRQKIVDAPLNLTLPHWQFDSTFDLQYHVRRHGLAGRHTLTELFREIAPAYETPFDRSRPLWEARVFEGVRGRAKAALFFKLHHAVADGVGGNAIFAAMTDWQREEADVSQVQAAGGKKAWGDGPGLGTLLADALRDRIALDVQRAGALANAVIDTVEHPENLARALAVVRSVLETARFDGHPPLRDFGRTRRLSGCDLPFAKVRELKQALGGSMIDVILTIMARAMRKWHLTHGMRQVRELMTLVPVNLRKPEQWTEQSNVGNVATGILVPLPIMHRDPLASFRDIHRRMQEKKADPASQMSPVLAEVLSVLPRSFFTWMSEATFGSVDFIVTNVPGILATRYLAGTEILGAYPFAPVAMRSAASIALYGYRDRLFVGLNSDATAMTDVEAFQEMIRRSFAELCAAAKVGARPAK
jgi:diacylglycerol O-acyltransferase